MSASTPYTAIGRLMEVISWHGKSIRHFRGHGTGIEDVLTTEVIQALDFLPRNHFLAPVIEACEGSALDARDRLADEAEALRVEAHADRYYLKPSLENHQSAIGVDPDVVFETPDVLAFIEAKRIAASAAFQHEQLARQYFVLTRAAGDRQSCLILLLGSEPPVKVKQILGKVYPADVIRDTLPAVYERADPHPMSLDSLLEHVEDHLLWITWQRLEGVVASAAKTFSSGNRSIDAAVARTAEPIIGCVARHQR